MEANVRSLLEAAVEAPSGENAQPWRFRVENNSVSLFHNASSDQSLYNYNNYGTLVCEGAALENMLVKAESLGLSTTLTMLPGGENLIGTIAIGGNTTAKNTELASAIPSRTTNRKAYSKKPLDQASVTAMEEAARLFLDSGIRVKRIIDRAAIEELAEVGSTNERIMLGNQELHSFFFSHLTWSAEEDRKQKVGFYIKTLELPPPAQVLFKLFRSWDVMRVLKNIGFTKVVGKQNAATYASSAEFGIITVPEINPKNMIFAGRVFERMWLTAASRGIELQPLTGTIFMNFFAEHVPTGHFSTDERNLLTAQIEKLYRVSGISQDKIVVMYRIGYGAKPSARATRFSIEELMI